MENIRGVISMAPILLLPMIQVASTASFAFEIVHKVYGSNAPITILVSVLALFLAVSD